MVAETRKKALVAGGVLVAAALVGACAWYVGTATGVTSADAEGAPALGNTLDNNDTAEKGELAVYDPAAEAGASGGEPLEGVVDGTPGDYAMTYGMEFQAPDLPKAVMDAIESGSLEGLPENHLTANLSPDDCVSCHTILE